MPAEHKPLYFNKHIIAALIITPILAIITWFAVDYNLREKPHVAAKDDAYQLLVMPNCRYQSGQCSLKNGDIALDLQINKLADDVMQLSVRSALPLNGVRIALSQDSQSPSSPPLSMQQGNEHRTLWQASTPAVATENSRLRIAVAVNGSYYFAELPTSFATYQTTYQRDFRRQAPL